MADPFADLKPAGDPFADLGASGDPFADLKAVPKGTPVATNRSGVTLGNVIAHPAESLSQLWDMAKQQGAAGFRGYSLLGASTDALAQAASNAEGKDALGNDIGAQQLAERQARDYDANVANAPKGPLEQALGFAASTVGASASPETFISAPERILAPIAKPVTEALAKFGTPKVVAKVAGKAAAKAVEQGAINTATDPVVQAANISSGVQDQFDPTRTAENAAMGAVAGGVLGGAHEAINAHGEAKAETARRIDAYIAKQNDPFADLSPETPSVPASPVAPQPTPEGVMASTVGSLRDSPDPVASTTATPNIQHLESNVADLAQNLREAVGATHRQGSVGAKDALGTYNPQSGVIRTLQMHELPVLAHEVGHHLEFTAPHPELMKAMATHENELRPLDYDPTLQRRHEGFAEFLRWYLTNPEHAKQVAPSFYPAFESAMSRDDPKVFKALQDTQAGYKTYLNAPSAARVAVHVIQAEPPSFIKDFVNKVKDGQGPQAIWDAANETYRVGVDRLHPLTQAENYLLDSIESRTGTRPDLIADRSPSALAQMAPGANNAGHMMIVHGPREYGGTRTMAPGLVEGLQEAMAPRAKGAAWSSDALREFDAYLTSRRMIGEWERYERGDLDQPPDSLLKGDYEVAKADYERMNPTWKDAADKVYAFQNGMWKLMHDAGFLTDEAYEHGLTLKDYVPAQRDRSDVPGLKRGTGTSGTGEFSGGAHRFQGSFRNVVSPTQMMMRNAYRLANQIARNDTIGRLMELADQAGPLGGKIAERLPRTQMTLNKVDALEALASAAKKFGMNERDITTLMDDVAKAMGSKDEAPADIFRAQKAAYTGQPVVYHWKDGIAQPIRLPDGHFGEAMMDAVTNMAPTQKQMFMELATLPARISRAGIVTHPAFALANVARDMITTYLNTDVGYHPGDTLSGIVHELRQTPLTEKYARAQGIVGGAQVASERDARINQSIKALQTKGLSIKRFLTWEALARASEVSETGTRLGVFDKAYKKALIDGLTDFEAERQGAYEARKYMDFDRRGASNTVNAVQRIDPFLRAWVLSADILVKRLTAEGNLHKALRPLLGGVPHTVQEKRAFALSSKALTTLAALSGISLGITALYRGDPEYESFNDDLRATHWIIRAGNHWAMIPKPYEWGSLPDLAERMFEKHAEGDPTAWSRFAHDMANIFLPPHDAPVFSIPFDLAANRNSMGQPIVPDQLRYGVDPELQVTPNTSAPAKWLGSKIHISPAVIDYIAQNVGTSWLRSAGQVLGTGKAPITNAPEDMPLTSRFVKDPARGSRPGEAFWNLVSQNGGDYFRKEGSFRALVNDDPQKAATYLQNLQPGERAYVMATYAYPGQMEMIHPLIRAQKIVTVLGALRSDILQGDVKGADLQPIRLTPDQRRDADVILQKRIMAEQTNGLIKSGEEGWEQRKPMPTDLPLPAGLDGALKARMMLAKAPDSPQMNQVLDNVWAGMRSNLEGQFPNLEALMEAKRSKGAGGMTRFVREITPAR